MSGKLFPFGEGKKPPPQDQAGMARLQGEVERLKKAVAELSVLNDLAVATTSALEVDRVLDVIVEKSIKAVRAEQGSILLVTEETDSPFKTLIRQADRSSRAVTYKVGMNVTGWVLKNQQPLLVEDLATDPRFPVKAPGEEAIRSLISVPIKFKGRIIGVLNLSNKKEGGPFTEDDLRLLSIIAAQSGQLIENSRLQAEVLDKIRMEEELRTAREIQRSLLPKSALRMEDLEISGVCLPAEEVGGDYFDYFPIDDHRVAVAMADVSGHGASAALVMSMVKGILHSLALDLGSASGILTRMNEILLRLAPRGMFVTMAYVVLDTKKKSLRFSNAGHNPLLLYRADTRSCEELEMLCPALALSGKSNYREEEHAVSPGSALLIYTDGVTEAMNELGEMFEAKRLLAAFSECGDQANAVILEHLQERLREFCGSSKQRDDVALVVARFV
jgi:serine phosphatase RsbU (regulator of sigma subunit)